MYLVSFKIEIPHFTASATYFLFTATLTLPSSPLAPVSAFQVCSKVYHYQHNHSAGKHDRGPLYPLHYFLHYFRLESQKLNSNFSQFSQEVTASVISDIKVQSEMLESVTSNTEVLLEQPTLAIQVDTLRRDILQKRADIQALHVSSLYGFNASF